MEFQFDQGITILRRTPSVLRALLGALGPEWTDATEGPGKWTPFDIVGHLLHADRANWVPRIDHLLRHGAAAAFPTFDREAMFAASQGLSLRDLLDAFERARAESLTRLDGFHLDAANLTRRGRHPDFGAVTLGQLLATWVVHDLAHLGQVARVMARQYGDAVGPWRAYLTILGPA